MKIALLIASVFLFISCSDESAKKETTSNEIVQVSELAKRTYRVCAECHGTDGKNKAFGISKVISGWAPQKVEKAIRGYIDGTYGGSMKGIMRVKLIHLTDKEIKEVSLYVSQLK